MAEPIHQPANDVEGNTSPWKADLISGFLVFLIALPLCLAIAKASNYPPIAGIWTAVLGGLLCTFISNSQMTIKGPAAGLIVIVAGAVTAFASEFGGDLPEGERLLLGYRLALGVGVVAGVIQILFGLCRVGKLGDFFPLSAVHGMLAAIGVIIIAKQSYIVFGVDPERGAEPLELLWHLPIKVPELNPEIAFIGIVSLLILFGMPLIRSRVVRSIPAPMVVLLVTVPLGMYFDLDHRHTYLFPNSFFDTNSAAEYEVGPRFLVDMPEVLSDPSSAFAFPDFRGVFTLTGLKFILLFSLIGSLESLLSAKAIDLIDPLRRKTNLDRDLAAIGVANTVSSLIGGMPMISEIVRSSANINNGARTRFANLFHGLFLLTFVLLVPNLIHRIPLASLAAMLCYTGYRLASPAEFVKTYRIGLEQLAVFVVTIVATLATDLLIGIGVGIATEVVILVLNGVPFRSLVRPSVEVQTPDATTCRVAVLDAAVFGNWLGLKARIGQLADAREVVVDLSDTHFVDHSVMEKLHEMERDFEQHGRKLTVVGLEKHDKFSNHPFSARKRRKQAVSV